jgi:hypothetical protein
MADYDLLFWDKNESIGLAGAGVNAHLMGASHPSVISMYEQFIVPIPDSPRGFIIKGTTYIKLLNPKSSGGYDHFVFGSDEDRLVDRAEQRLDSGSVFQPGRDYYIYLCYKAPDGAQRKAQADIVISLNSTFPAGYNADNSRKIGGFHTLCMGAGSLPNFNWGGQSVPHPLSGFLAGDILPRSFWDLLHRPTCQPEGMVNLSLLPDIWVDIYLMSGIGRMTASAFQGTITRNRQYHLMLEEDLPTVGKTGMTSVEFAAAARGSNEQTAVQGANEAGATSNGAGGKLDTAGRRAISADGCEQCCGSLWQALADSGAGGHITASATISGWNGSSQVTLNSNGPHPQEGGRGSFWGLAGVLLAGGPWADGTSCGSASRGANSARSSAGTANGCRGRARSRVSR